MANRQVSRHPPILALGYSEAAMLLRRPDGGNVRAIMSICGARELGVEAAVAKRLDLKFDDVAAMYPSDMESMVRARAQQRWAAEMGRPLRAPMVEDVWRIVEFASDVRDADGVVLCQCGAGISRSPAAALICLATWTAHGDEPYCAGELLRVRPAAVPHGDLVRYADELLGRNGQLVAALREALRVRDRPPRA